MFIFVDSISGQRPVDCGDIGSGRSGVYTIYPKGSADSLKVLFYFFFVLRSRRGHMLVRITATCVISVYHH
jgi:hypothetical protein